jgi:hypothetical protein
MANTVKTNRVSQLAADQKLIDGTKQLLASLSSIPVGGQNMTPAEIEQFFQERIDAGNEAVKAEDARKAAVKADRDLRKNTAPVASAFKRIVIGMFLQAPDKLGIFGLTAPRVGKKTAATKAAAVETANATKKARGPIGKKQRAKVKATPVTMVPATGPAAPSKVGS